MNTKTLIRKDVTKNLKSDYHLNFNLLRPLAAMHDWITIQWLSLINYIHVVDRAKRRGLRRELEGPSTSITPRFDR